MVENKKSLKMEERDNKQDEYYDPRSLLNPSERDCLQKIEEEEDLLERLHDQREAALERLWSTFQSAASSLAQQYKERPVCDCCERCIYRQNNHDRWLPFQGAANRVTHLYRDGSEALRAGIELGYHAGYQKRNRDIANWSKKKRRNIRREDILSHLSGRSPPRKKISESRSANGLSLSPKPHAMESDLLTFGENKDFDFTAFMEGRNPFTDGGRKRHTYNDMNMHDSPHKRGRFC